MTTDSLREIGSWWLAFRPSSDTTKTTSESFPMQSPRWMRSRARESRQLFELGRFGFETFEERIREHAPAVLRSALDAAVVAVADTVEAFRVGDRERAEHDRVDQCEDRGRAADTERERQDGRGREDGREAELTDRVTDGADRVGHADRLDGRAPPSADAVPKGSTNDAQRSSRWSPHCCLAGVWGHEAAARHWLEHGGTEEGLTRPPRSATWSSAGESREGRLRLVHACGRQPCSTRGLGRDPRTSGTDDWNGHLADGLSMTDPEVFM